jgi:predicted nucleic acid-binding protein
VANRRLATNLTAQISTSARFRVVHGSDELFVRGFDLFRRRPDKEWSLTDCISFVVMGDEGLADALTADRHFEQAGFTVLIG